MNILVTGAAGFIGSHVSENLLQKNHVVHGLDNLDEFYNPLIKLQNIELLNNYSNFSFTKCDIRDSQNIHQLFAEKKFELVIHLAAKAGVRPSILEAREYMDVNVNGLTNLLEASRLNGLKRFIFASSSSVYGNQKKIPYSESDDVSYPVSPYAASKRAGELCCHAYHHLYGIEIACLRLFTVYGPRQRPDLAIHKFIKLALANEPVKLYGKGHSLRDYTYVDDIVQGILKISFHNHLTYEIFNLGNGNPVDLLTMVKTLESALSKKIEINHIEQQAGDVDQTFADISKAQTFFDYKPVTDLQNGIINFVDWYQQQNIK